MSHGHNEAGASYETNFQGDVKEEMAKQLREILAKVESGDITAYVACGVNRDNTIWGAGLTEQASNLKLLHDAIMVMHETFHDCVDQATAEQVASGDLSGLLVMTLGGDDDDKNRQH